MNRMQRRDAVLFLFNEGLLRAECVTCRAPVRRFGQGLDFDCPEHGLLTWASNQVSCFAVQDVKLPWKPGDEDGAAPPS
jgi:hypothetical protein